MSRRRLVFAEDQIYYECGAMVGYECFQLPPGNLHSKTMRKQETFVRGGLFSGTEEGSTNSFRQAASIDIDIRRDRVLAHVRNYSHRKLTYNNDILNAIHGILASLQVDNIVGLVLRSPPSQIIKREMSDIVPHWIPDQARRDFGAGLVGWWHEGLPEVRIPEFPSWSWAGWRGSVGTPRRLAMPDKLRVICHLSDISQSELLEPTIGLLSSALADEPGPPRVLVIRGHQRLNLERCRLLVSCSSGLKIQWRHPNPLLGEFLDLRLELSVRLEPSTEMASDTHNVGPQEVNPEVGTRLVFMTKVAEDLLFMVIRRLPNSKHYERIGVGFLKHRVYRAAVAAGEERLLEKVPVDFRAASYFIY